MTSPHGAHGAHARRGHLRHDFSQAPFLVIWETTRACDLACKHCRAEAIVDRSPFELSTDEAKRLMDEVRRFGRIVFVLSGGDPVRRPDLLELVRHGADLGLRMGLTPATTPRLTPELLGELKRAGLARLAVSLDGSNAEIHDEFRQVEGSFREGLRILRQAKEAGLSTQVNTTVSRHNIHDFPQLCALMSEVGIVFWEVFFLVPTGRASAEDVASAEEFEAVFHQLYDLSKEAPFDIKATAAPHYARVVLERQIAERRAGQREEAPDPLTAGLFYSLQDGIGRARGVTEGDGYAFVDHVGEIYPSGFLPVSAGNVRDASLVEVYRNAPLFRQLRDRELLKGKCGACEFRNLCGGCRARAFAMTGDYLESDPFCAYEPAGWRKLAEAGAG
ncbi:MAG: TIGR04053 family radical SAM/SPASM domain-containing protein [Gemmatimonadota bacterium]|nr:MAG: TIGR04053 family radical SAM/SPASM domain-containing protein [Gemmatimonadota bacterium]